MDLPPDVVSLVLAASGEEGEEEDHSTFFSWSASSPRDAPPSRGAVVLVLAARAVSRSWNEGASDALEVLLGQVRSFHAAMRTTLTTRRLAFRALGRMHRVGASWRDVLGRDVVPYILPDANATRRCTHRTALDAQCRCRYTHATTRLCARHHAGLFHRGDERVRVAGRSEADARSKEGRRRSLRSACSPDRRVC